MPIFSAYLTLHSCRGGSGRYLGIVLEGWKTLFGIEALFTITKSGMRRELLGPRGIRLMNVGGSSGNISLQKMINKLLGFLNTALLSQKKRFYIIHRIWIKARRNGSDERVVFIGQPIKNSFDVVLCGDWASNNSKIVDGFLDIKKKGRNRPMFLGGT